MGLEVDVSSLQNLANQIADPAGLRLLDQIAFLKSAAALVAQAIADNFAKEGPGWAPLSPATIRASLTKKNKKRLKKFSNDNLATYEEFSRASGQDVLKKILQGKNRILYKSVTSPSAAHNIYKPENGKIVWGTDLVYAAVHNYGNGPIPQREYLVIREEWRLKLEAYMLDRVMKILMANNFK